MELKQHKMKPNDLRLGNLIYWNIPEKENIIHTVVGIRNEKPQTIPISLGDSIDDYKPIPLTEDWLLKFGYILQPWGYVKEESPLIRFSLTPNEKYWVELGNGFKIELPFVHSLQNMMSLTQK